MPHSAEYHERFSKLIAADPAGAAKAAHAEERLIRETVRAGEEMFKQTEKKRKVDEDLKDIARVALSLKLDGLIVSNTTIERPPVVQNHIHGHETGGLSGKPLFAKSTEVLHRMYKLTKGKVVLGGVGGVSSGEDAYKKIRAGATLVELYTALSFEGPALVPRIKRELVACLARDGFKSVVDAVGADHA